MRRLKTLALGVALLVALIGCSDDQRVPVTAFGAGTAASGASAGGPQLQSASHVDKDGDGLVSEGDVVRLTFSGDVEPPAPSTDPDTELPLVVDRDTYGQGATVEVDSQDATELVVTLGTSPILRITGTFSGDVRSGSPSGITVSAQTSLQGTAGGPLGGAPVDLDGNLSTGFVTAASMKNARAGHTATTLKDGRVLVVGGWQGKNQFVTTCEIYDPVADAFQEIGPLPAPKGVNPGRIGHTATLLGNGKVLIVGGYGIERKIVTPSRTVTSRKWGWKWKFPFFKKWKKKKVIPGKTRIPVEALRGAVLFDPAKNKFSTLKSKLSKARTHHEAILLSDGRVLVAGGFKKPPSGGPVAKAEIFDPKTGRFSDAGQLNQARRHVRLALVPGDGVLAIGGRKGSGLKYRLSDLTQTVERWRGMPASFRSVGRLRQGRMFHAATTLSNGSVLVSGGQAGKTLKSAEVFDAGSGSWQRAGAMTTARARHTQTVVGNGTEAVAIGGYAKGPNLVALGDAEVFDGKGFSSTHPMATPRAGQSVARLLDGRLLVTGGFQKVKVQKGWIIGKALKDAEFFVRP